MKEIRIYLTKLRLNPERIDKPKKEVRKSYIFLSLRYLVLNQPSLRHGHTTLTSKFVKFIVG